MDDESSITGTVSLGSLSSVVSTQSNPRRSHSHIGCVGGQHAKGCFYYGLDDGPVAVAVATGDDSPRSSLSDDETADDTGSVTRSSVVKNVTPSPQQQRGVQSVGARRAFGYPEPPASVSAEPGDASAVVWWSAASAVQYPDRPILRYNIKRYRLDGAENDQPKWTFKGVATVGEGSSVSVEEEDPQQQAQTSTTIDGLTNGHSYRFRVTAENETGESFDSAWSNIVEANEPLPDGWAVFTDEFSGVTYFHNHKTQTTTWERPAEDPFQLDTSIILKWRPEEIDAFKKAFNDMDWDKSGGIGAQELLAILQRLGESITMNGIMRLMKMVELDDEGELTFNGLVCLLEIVRAERRSMLLANRKWHQVLRESAAATLDSWRGKIKNMSNISLRQKGWVIRDKSGGKKMGVWDKFHHETLDRPYYYNRVTGETQWQMPASIKYFVPEELRRLMIQSYTDAELREFRSQFTNMDLDGSGAIDKDELRVIMEGLGEKLSDARLEALVKEVDLDRSGEVDYDEYLLMLHSIKSGEEKKKKRGFVAKFMARVRGGDAGTDWSNLERRYVEKGQSSQARWQTDLKAKLNLTKKKQLIHGELCLCGCRRNMRRFGRR